MEDKQIVDLFWERSEAAISETQKKYDRYCKYIACNILHNTADAEECTSDAYFRLWELIPPHYPEKLSAFLGKIVRGLAIDRLRRRLAKRRGMGDDENGISEAESEFLSQNAARDGGDMEESYMQRDAINRFLGALPRETRIIFVQKYWYMSTVREIAHELGISESNVKTALLRTREKLAEFMKKEGFDI